MKHQTRIFLGTLLALLLALPSLAQAKETAEQAAGKNAIASAYARHNEAFKNKDINGIVGCIAPDYQQYPLKGKVVDRSRYVTSWSKFIKGPIDFDQTNTNIKSIEWRGPDAIVIAETTISYFTGDGSKTIHHISFAVCRDYWSKGSNGWQIRQSVERVLKSWRTE